MALPQLNNFPKYEVNIPSKENAIKFRPFLVKEQKILLMAYETKDKKGIINAILDTISACAEDLDVKTLPTYEVDYTFSQIRAKSVGEKVDIFLKCRHCDHENPHVVNLEQVKIDGANTGEKTVEITKDISVIMRYPTYETMLGTNILDNEFKISEIIYETIKACIYSVNTKDEQILVKDETAEELDNFINSLSSQQFEKLNEFIQDMPILKYESNFNCVSCDKENKVVLEGLDDFF